MTLRQQIKDDFDALLDNSGEFEETAIYTPKGGSPTSIKVFVWRGNLSPTQFDRNAGPTRVEWKLAISASRTDIPAVNINGDTIAIKEKEEDATASDFTFRAIINDQDPAAILIGLS